MIHSILEITVRVLIANLYCHWLIVDYFHRKCNNCASQRLSNRNRLLRSSSGTIYCSTFNVKGYAADSGVCVSSAKGHHFICRDVRAVDEDFVNQVYTLLNGNTMLLKALKTALPWMYIPVTLSWSLHWFRSDFESITK